MRSFSIGVYRMKLSLFESLFTMFDDRCELRQRHEFVRLYDIFFLARSRRARVVFPAGVSFFPVHPPSDEISGGFGAGFVRRFEDDSVPKIKDRNLRFLFRARCLLNVSPNAARAWTKLPRQAGAEMSTQEMEYGIVNLRDIKLRRIKALAFVRRVYWEVDR
jgi:hypothetical protein